MREPSPALRLEGICKRFGSVEALKGVDFAAYPGEVMALVGDNGSGKSTLAKIITGLLAPDAGSINVGCHTYKRLSASEARAEGIGAVYQHLALDDEKDCAANIFLGREITRMGFFLDKRTMRRSAHQMLNEMGLSIPDESQPVKRLSGGQRQALAIARAVCFPHDIIVFDEPTSAMGVRETDRIMGLFRSLKTQGKAIVLISHNIFQVFDISDRITVLRHGRVTETLMTKDSTPDQLWNSIAHSSAEVTL